MAMVKTLKYAIGAMLLAVTMAPAPSYAFKGVEELPSLSYELSKPKKEIYKDMELHQEQAPVGDPKLAMEVRLPAGWTKFEDKFDAGELSEYGEKDEEKDATDIFRPLARYVSPPRMEWRSEFRVRSIEIKSLISLKNWFIIYTVQMGFSPEGVSVVSDTRIDVQYTLFEDGEPMVVRAVIERVKNKIIMAEYMVHQDNYENEKNNQIASMATFRMIHPDDSLPIGLSTYAFVDIAKFNYPETWLIYAPDVSSIDRMEASVINIKGLIAGSVLPKDLKSYQLNGRIDITMISKYIDTTVEKEVITLGSKLREDGLILGEKILDIKDVKVHDLVTASNIKVYSISPPQGQAKRYKRFTEKGFASGNKLAEYEYWLAVLETRGRYYLIRLLTVGQGEDFRAWSENTEVFKVLVSSVAPVNDTAH